MGVVFEGEGGGVALDAEVLEEFLFGGMRDVYGGGRGLGLRLGFGAGGGGGFCWHRLIIEVSVIIAN